MSYPRALLVIALLALGACTDRVKDPAAVDPGGETEPQPKPAPLPIGVYEVVLTGLDGSDGPHLSKAVALPVGPSNALNPVASGLTLEQVSVSSFTEGSRGLGGHRYISVTFRVRNTTGGALNNVTYIPVTTASTIAGTPFSLLATYNGTAANAAIAQQMVPTGAVFLGDDATIRSRYVDVLQAFTEAEVAAIALPAGYTGIFPYGFVVSNPNSTTSRTLPNAADANDFGGMVTFAFRFPLQATANADPFTVALQVLAVQDTETRITESIEDGQDSSAVRRIRERATSLAATTTTVLNGSSAVSPDVADYPGQRQLCTVRTAGTSASPTRFVNNPAAYTQVALLYPGESMNACSAYFRSGTPGRPATNVPFTVTLKSVDHYGNVITTAVDTVVLRQQTGPAHTVSLKQALVSGSRDLTVTYSDYGTSLLGGVGRRNDGWRIVPVAGVTRTWTAGAATTDWHTNSNWSPAAVPMSLDSVVVPLAAPLDPVLAANVFVQGVTVEDGATLSLNAFDLTAEGNVFAGLTGGITNTTGRVILAGTAKTIQGRMPRLVVSGTYSMTGNVTARAPLQVNAGRITNANGSSYRLQAESN